MDKVQYIKRGNDHYGEWRKTNVDLTFRVNPLRPKPHPLEKFTSRDSFFTVGQTRIKEYSLKFRWLGLRYLCGYCDSRYGCNGIRTVFDFRVLSAVHSVTEELPDSRSHLVVLRERMEAVGAGSEESYGKDVRPNEREGKNSMTTNKKYLVPE